MPGLWLRAYRFEVYLFCLLSVFIFCPNSTFVGLLLVFELVGFMELEHGFHGHVGPCRICRLCSDILLVVYIYIYISVVMQLILVLQVAVACLFLCWFCFFILFGFWD